MIPSKNGVAVSIFIVEAMLTSLGIEFEAGSVAKIVEGSVVLAALLLAVWNQIDRENVKWFLLKLKQ